MEGPTWDAVVIGGGHNGLACAAYLARGGQRVCVLEARDLLGGAAVTEEPWPGYRVSSASYVVSLLPPEVVEDLRLRDFGYRVSLIEPDYFLPYEDGTSLTIWSDAARTAEEIASRSAADAAAYMEFDRYFDRVARLLRNLMTVIPPDLTRRDIPEWIRLGARLRSWTQRDVVDVVRVFTMSAADFLDEWFEDERVKGALATQALVGAWGGPMSPGSAYVLLHHWVGEVEGHIGGWGWVHGGMGALSEALAASARSYGAQTRTGAAVESVVVEGGRARGVRLADGEVVHARRVVSSAHPVTTYLGLVGEAHLPDEVTAAIRRYRSRSGSVKVNLALDRLPVPSAWAGEVPGDPHRGLIAISPSVEYLERAWDDAKYGRTSAEPYVELVLPTAIDSSLAPPDRHLALCFTQFGPYELAEGSWDTERERYGRRVVSLLDAYMPGLADSVEHMEVLSPPDMEARYGLLGGNIMHGELSIDQMFSLRPVPGYADHRTPVEGLYLCGSGTHPGGGVMAVPGRNAAMTVLGDARREQRRARLRLR
ncbi:MAG TPA: NAD(P)/FAD-dependent oxidoreductase [Gaiellaceae bacterium]|nr:NAD(P)/FAD-dependent oxidoreductase [Gaiellaceae bacterium]